MKSLFNKVFQSVALAGNVFVQYSDFIPPKVKAPVAVGIGVAQTIVGIIAHFYNPDGTKAQ